MATSPNILSSLNLDHGLTPIQAGVSLTKVNLTPSSVAADTTAEQSFTVIGLQDRAIGLK